jgi:hypothetical protein
MDSEPPSPPINGHHRRSFSLLILSHLTTPLALMSYRSCLRDTTGRQSPSPPSNATGSSLNCRLTLPGAPPLTPFVHVVHLVAGRPLSHRLPLHHRASYGHGDRAQCARVPHATRVGHPTTLWPGVSLGGPRSAVPRPWAKLGPLLFSLCPLSKIIIIYLNFQLIHLRFEYS